MATPRAGRGSAGSAAVATCDTRGSSSSSQGSKVSSPMRTDANDVRGRAPSTAVSKTVSYAQALKTPALGSKTDSSSSSKLTSPSQTPSESPYQSKVPLHSGTATPSGSIVGMSSPSPSIGERLASSSLPSPVGAGSEPVGAESEVGSVDLRGEQVEMLTQTGELGVGQVQGTEHLAASPITLKQVSKVEGVVTTTVTAEESTAIASQPHLSPTVAEEVMVMHPPATPPLKDPCPPTPPLKENSPEEDKPTSDPGVCKDTPLTAPVGPQQQQAAPGLMRVPPGLPIPVPTHAHNLTDHQKLLTQQQKLLASSRPYAMAPPGRGGSILSLVQPLLPPAQHHILEQQQQREHQARMMKAQEIPYHLSSHTHGHSGHTPPHLPYPLPHSHAAAIQTGSVPKSSVLHTPIPVRQTPATRPLLGNQHPSLSMQQQAELLLHFFKQQQQQQQALQKQNFMMQQQQVQHSKGLEKVEPSPAYTQALAQQLYQQQQQHSAPLHTNKPDIMAMAPYLLPNTHLTTPQMPLGASGPAAPPPTVPQGAGHAQVAAMFAPVGRPYMQQPAQQRPFLSQVPVDSSPPQAPPPGPGAPPSAKLETLESSTEIPSTNVGVVSESEGSEEQQQSEALKSSNLNITATPFIPMAQDSDQQQGPTQQLGQQGSAQGPTQQQGSGQQLGPTTTKEPPGNRNISSTLHLPESYPTSSVPPQPHPTSAHPQVPHPTSSHPYPTPHQVPHPTSSYPQVLRPTSSHPQMPRPTSTRPQVPRPTSARPQVPRATSSHHQVPYPTSSHPHQVPHPTSSHLSQVPRPSLSLPPQVPVMYPTMGTGRGPPAMPHPPVSGVMTAQLVGAHTPVLNQRKLREEQAYQVISPQVEHSGVRPVLRQLSGGTPGDTSLHIKDTSHFRLPSHMGLTGDPGGMVIPQIAPVSIEMQVRPQKGPFTHYAIPAAQARHSKIVVGGAMDPLVARTLSQGQHEVATGTSKRALLPTPVQPSHPSHASLMPPHIAPAQSWTIPRGAGPAIPAVHGHSSQQVMYPEQRNMPGYSTGAGPSLLGVNAYHRTQI